MGRVNEEIFKQVFEKELLNESYRELAEAVICGSKCGSLIPQELTGTTNPLMNELFAYYGQNINDETASFMKGAIPIELKKFHPDMTIEEISMGVRLALREQFGEIIYKTVSIKLFNELVNKYSNSEPRKRVLSAYAKARESMRPETNILTQEDKDRFIIDALCQKHEKFCKEGPQSIVLTFMDYDALLKFTPTPDYKEFLLPAAERLKELKPKGNETTMTDEMKRFMGNSIAGEAKKMAVEKLFKSLQDEGATLKDYMKSCSTS